MINKDNFFIQDIENLNKLEYRKRILNSHFFHSIEWMSLVNETLGVEYKIAILQENNETVASIPFAFYRNFIKGPCAIPLQFSGYYGSIVANSNLYKKKIMNHFFQYCERKKLYTQIPEINSIDGYKSHSGYSIYKIELKNNLPVEEQILSYASKRTRGYIKSAINSNLKSFVGGLELIDEFYFIYLQNMKELGTPPLPESYFKKIIEYLPKVSKVILVKDHKKVCSGMFIMQISEKELFTPIICTPRLYQTGQSSHLIYLKAAEEAQNFGCSIVNFGRSIDGGGPALFKKRYGLKASPLFIYSPNKKWKVTDPNNTNWRYAIEIWKRLPIFLTKLAGKILAKHVI